MRIIGGRSGGLLLKSPKGYEVRPTPDLVKQAVFNSLAGRVAGATVLDLFSGTGALALECLSREVGIVVCVEKHPRHADFIRLNLAALNLPKERLELRVQDVFLALAQLSGAAKQFDLIFADPPYGEKNVGRRSTSFAQRLLDDVHLQPLLNPAGIFVLGHTKRDTLTIPASWREAKVLKHGDSMMRFFRRVVPVTDPKAP